jgi:hypothetical protein
VAGAVQGSQRVTDFLAWMARNFDRSVTWADLDWVRHTWDGPIVVKGVLDVADARDAVRAGAQGLVVSNHGGRQLDGVRSSITALPKIADAVGGDLELFMDGGVRSGLDVLKALALGARACFIGRAWAYALSAGGEAGVVRMLQILRAELEVAMILTGCRSAGTPARTARPLTPLFSDGIQAQGGDIKTRPFRLSPSIGEKAVQQGLLVEVLVQSCGIGSISLGSSSPAGPTSEASRDGRFCRSMTVAQRGQTALARQGRAPSGPP